MLGRLLWDLDLCHNLEALQELRVTLKLLLTILKDFLDVTETVTHGFDFHVEVLIVDDR